MNSNPEEVLKDLPHHKQLDHYCKRYYNKEGHLIEKRNKAWITGSYDKELDESELLLQLLFESDMMVVKQRYIIDPTNDIEKQIIESYEDFYIDVMNFHFNK